MRTRLQRNSSKISKSYNSGGQSNNVETNDSSINSTKTQPLRIRDRDATSTTNRSKPKNPRSLLKPVKRDENGKTFNVLIGVTGSVATIKLIELTKKIKSMFPKSYTSKTDGSKVLATVAIKIVMTKNSKHFVADQELKGSFDEHELEIYDDENEWSSWKKIGDPVLHIELRKWADLCLIAPLDANTMAKLACGICDNLLTCIVRAWDVSKPLVYCPAMNVHMYNHPITREHLCKLQSYGYLRVDCVEKRLACGDVGMGGMATVDSIADKVVDCLIQPVTLKLSPTKPLLNQLPTYPILATTDEQGYLNRALFDETMDFDFDPSKLLEQSMITDEFVEIDRTSCTDARNDPHPNDNNMSLSFQRDSKTKVGGLSPLLNTSRFLELCDNKEKGCFTCAICKHDYKNRKSMARHLKEQHVQGNIFHCRPCGVSYKRREKLIKHNREKHTELLTLGS